MNVREYLRSKGLVWTETRRPSGLQAIMECPQCHDKKSFAISIETGAFQCFRKNNCGIHGSWSDFQRLMGDKPLPLDGDHFFHNPKEKQYKLPQVKSDPVKESLYNYFAQRSIKRETVKAFRIGIKNNAVMFPHFEDGEIRFIKYRSMAEKKFWNEEGCRPILFNMDSCKDESVLRIVEGHFDVLAAREYGINCVSVPNGVSDLSWIETCWNYIEQFKYIHLFFDNDDAGQGAIKNIVTRLGLWRCYNVILPEKDFNDCLIKKISIDKIVEAESNAIEFYHYSLKKANDFRDKVKELNKQKEKRYGYSSCISGITAILRGWRECEVTIVHGRSGSGKSTFVNQELLHFIEIGKSSCVASLELPPQRYLTWMCIQHNKKSSLDDDMIDKAFDFFGNNIFVINKTGEISKDDLFDAFTFAARKYGVKFFVIDSLMRLKFNYRYELQEQKDFISDCSQFAKDYDCHVFVIAHPRKGEYGNKKPVKEDVSGTGDITNLADNVIATWRPDNDDVQRAIVKEEVMSEAYFYIQKNREWGTTDYIEFEFDEKSKLFSQKYETETEKKLKSHSNPGYFQD